MARSPQFITIIPNHRLFITIFITILFLFLIIITREVSSKLIIRWEIYKARVTRVSRVYIDRLLISSYKPIRIISNPI